MKKSLEQMKSKEAPNKDDVLTDKDATDQQMLVKMGVDILEQGKGIDIIKTALEGSKDPAQVVGQVMSQVLMALAEQTVQELGVNPKVFLAKGGWLNDMLDYLEGKLGLPPEFSEEVWYSVVETVKAAVQSAQKAGQTPQPGQPPQGQPPMGGGQPAPANGPQMGGM